MELKGLEAWLPENGPQTEDEWLSLEVGWCKTFLRHGIPFGEDYFTNEAIERAEKELAGERVIETPPIG